MLRHFNPSLVVRQNRRTTVLRRFSRGAWGYVFVALGCCGAARADDPSNLTNLTFEQLAGITITTASAKEEPLWRVASAFSVITREEIQRSGATLIPEALRYVPGLEVAQINAHDWAISARGSNSRFANQQLVLVDGRTIYSPFSAGVYWELAGPPLAEIERIEIIRGPGATVWGANAVNGVINILTQSARETQGGLLSVGGGSEKNFLGYLRQGFQPGAHTWVRVYGEYNRANEAEIVDGRKAGDAWHTARFGLRLDSELTGTGQLMVQAEFASGQFGDPGYFPVLTPPYRADIPVEPRQYNAHLQTRWTRNFSADSILTVQAFWSREDRRQYRNDFCSDTFDASWTHQLAWGGRQSIVWGGGARKIAHQLTGKVGMVFPDVTPTDEVFNGFVQDEIQLIPQQLSLTLGSKLEHNNITGLEPEPSLRIAWTPTAHFTLWSAASRAVHTPSVLERNIFFDAAVVTPPLAIVRQISVGNALASVQHVYELGVRWQPAATFSLDGSVFHNDLPHGQVFERGAPFPEASPAPAHFVVPLRIGPVGVDGRAWGVELAATWQATPHWRLSAEYSHFEKHLKLTPTQSVFSAQSPRNRVGLRSACDLGRHWQIDLGVRHVAAMPGTSVAAYTSGEAQLLWRPDEHWEISVVGQNLFSPQHVEMPASTLSDLVAIERSIHARITLKF